MLAVRICLQTRNARNASTKFQKDSESKKRRKVPCSRVFLFALRMEDLHTQPLVFEHPDGFGGECAPTHLLCKCSGQIERSSQPAKKDARGVLFCWLGWPDLNRRMPESKSGALPLGDIPKCRRYYNILLSACQDFFTFIIYY